MILQPCFICVAKSMDSCNTEGAAESIAGSSKPPLIDTRRYAPLVVLGYRGCPDVISGTLLDEASKLSSLAGEKLPAAAKIDPTKTCTPACLAAQQGNATAMP